MGESNSYYIQEEEELHLANLLFSLLRICYKLHKCSMPDSATLASPMVVGLVMDEEEKLSCHLLHSSRNYITT
jgi:hypothetical protein